MPECNEWVPYAGTVYRQVVSDTVLNTSQGLIWNTSKMENLQEMGGFYLYEIRRSKDYWNFLQPGFLCLYCFVEYATNFPNPDALTFVEENDAALSICCLRLPEDEEAKMNGGRHGGLLVIMWRLSPLRVAGCFSSSVSAPVA